MAVLVTRPYPDNEATAAALRARGIEALLAPMLQFEALGFHDDPDVRFDAIIATSANAFRAITDAAAAKRLQGLPVFVVGGNTAKAAQDAGFSNVIDADGDAAALRERVKSGLKPRKDKQARTLLYLAGSDLARDLAAELGEQGFTVVTQTTYRMTPLRKLPAGIGEAMASHQIEAVLHYSRRSARAFIEAAQDAGMEVSVLALPQCCLSDAIGAVMRESGAARVSVAAAPNETALFDSLMRATNRVSR